MKKVILFAACLSLSFAAMTQTAVPYQKRAVQVEKSVRDTVINGAKYPIFQGARGGYYMYITSKNGNVYRKYLKG